MSLEYLPYIVDGILVILLVSAIILFIRVSRQLAAMKSGQDEFKGAADQLMRSVTTAERSVAGIKVSAADVQEKLGGEIKRAKALTEELKLITEAGDNLANRIERSIDHRKSGGQAEAGSSAVKAKANPAADSLSAAHKEQRELLAALKDAR